MADKSKERRKGSIGEEEVSGLLRRYSVSTVLALLREVADVAGEKIDWHELVKKTATGISSARECQLLWRHLAYGGTLADPPAPDASTADDDSDLEFELEAFPAIGREASMEAAACVKVLMGSNHSKDIDVPNNATIEAPLTINIPNQLNSLQCTNISIPVTLQKQALTSGILGEKRRINGVSGVDLPARRKRRAWSTDEDVKLTSAVQKHGEGNWFQIASGEFCNDRKESELSQRWTNLKKKQADLKVGVCSQTSVIAAARRAFNMALENPKVPGQMNSVGMKPNNQTQAVPASQSQGHQQLGKPVPPNSQMQNIRPSVNPAATPDSMVKAAAVAAGARIATPKDAATLLDTTRSQNIVRIPTGVGSVKKPSGTCISSQLPSNVHFISNGLAKAPISSYSATKSSHPRDVQHAETQPTKPAAATVQSIQMDTSPSPALLSVPSVEVPVTVAESGVSIKEEENIQRDQGADQAHSAALDDKAGVGHQTSVSGNAAPTGDPTISMSVLPRHIKDDQVTFPSSAMKGERDAGDSQPIK